VLVEVRYEELEMITNERILEIAKKHKYGTSFNYDKTVKEISFWPEGLIAFARTIAKEQREIDAKMVEKCNPHGHSFGHWSVVVEHCAAAIRNQVRQDEPKELT
jgi:hypothetical protein